MTVGGGRFALTLDRQRAARVFGAMLLNLDCYEKHVELRKAPPANAGPAYVAGLAQVLGWGSSRMFFSRN